MGLLLSFETNEIRIWFGGPLRETFEAFFSPSVSAPVYWQRARTGCVHHVGTGMWVSTCLGYSGNTCTI